MKPHIKAAKEQGRQVRTVQFILWIVTAVLLIGTVSLIMATVGCLQEDAKNVKDKLEVTR